MDIFSLLFIIHRQQCVRIVDSKTSKTIYEGNKFYAPCTGMEAKEIYVEDYTLVIKAEKI
jgi:hypothetical protein